jgi:ribosomal protein L21E
MLNEKVLISAENNYYDGMVGWVIEEKPATVLVEIKYTDTKHQVMFYKEQVEVVFPSKLN